MHGVLDSTRDLRIWHWPLTPPRNLPAGPWTATGSAGINSSPAPELIPSLKVRLALFVVFFPDDRSGILGCFCSCLPTSAGINSRFQIGGYGRSGHATGTTRPTDYARTGRRPDYGRSSALWP